jgi:hypothetical protein
MPSQKMPKKRTQQGKKQADEEANRINQGFHKHNSDGLAGTFLTVMGRLSGLGPLVTYKRELNL